jgi:hypothetical protein
MKRWSGFYGFNRTQYRQYRRHEQSERYRIGAEDRIVSLSGDCTMIVQIRC